MKIGKWLTYLFLIGSLGFGSISLQAHSVASNPTEDDHVEEKITHIDHQIDSLEKLRNYYLAKAARYRTRASRIKFSQIEQEDVDSHQLVHQAEEYEKTARKLTREIQKLERQKRVLTKRITQD